MIHISHLIEQKNLLIVGLYLGLFSQAKDKIEIYNYYYWTKKTQTKKVNDKRKRLRYL